MLPTPDARLAYPTPLLDAISQGEMALLRLTSAMLIRLISPTAIASPSQTALRLSDSASAVLFKLDLAHLLLTVPQSLRGLLSSAHASQSEEPTTLAD